ncbi:MAG: hypothetical protein NZ580_00140 [Bacteroidia bacterium]|nr:hypothetical protein [Bacteroidia bacterium]MDW8235067.1 hypothetical protein [Bacteroidia bacterium]
MKWADLYLRMKAGTELTPENRKLVESVLEKYPYFSLGRMMLAKLATHLRDEHAAQHRFLGSLYAPSRQHYAFFLEEKMRPRVAPPPRLGATGRETQTPSPAPSREEEAPADDSGPEAMPFSSAFWPPLQGWIAARRVLYRGLSEKIIAQFRQRIIADEYSLTRPEPKVEGPLVSPPSEASAIATGVPVLEETAAASVLPTPQSLPAEYFSTGSEPNKEASHAPALSEELAPATEIAVPEETIEVPILPTAAEAAHPSFPSEEPSEASSVPKDLPSAFQAAESIPIAEPESVPASESTEPTGGFMGSGVELESITNAPAEISPAVTTPAVASHPVEHKVEKAPSPLPESDKEKVQATAGFPLESEVTALLKERGGEPPLPPSVIRMLLQFELLPGKGREKVESEKSPASPEIPAVSLEAAQAQPVTQAAREAAFSVEEERSSHSLSEEKVAAIPDTAVELGSVSAESTRGLHRRYIPLEHTMASVHLSAGEYGAIPETPPAPPAEPPVAGLHRAYVPLEEVESPIHLAAEKEDKPTEAQAAEPSISATSQTESSAGGLLRKYVPLEETMRSLSTSVSSSEQMASSPAEEPPSGGLLGRYVSLEETMVSLQAERSRILPQEETPKAPAEPLPTPSTAPAETASGLSVEVLISESPLRPLVPLEAQESDSVHLPMPEEPPTVAALPGFPESWQSFLKELKVDTSIASAKPATFSQELGNIRRQFIKKLLDERSIRPHVPVAPPAVSLIDKVIEKLHSFPRSSSVTMEQEVPELSAPVRESAPATPRIYTETMAKLYWSQGDLPRAIQVYEALSAKNPEKADYYRQQIARIQSGEMP